MAIAAWARQGWFQLLWRVRRLVESDKVRRAHRREVKVRRWYVRWRQRLWLFPLAVLSLGWALFSLAVLVFDWRPVADFTDSKCGGGYGMFCGAVTGFVLPLLGLAFGYAVFLLRRYTRVRRWYQGLARSRPQSLVPTAGIIGDVVGRDQLCDVLIGELRDPVTRRPHILVGGVGTGKTAVLVNLVSRLAAKNVVPVTVRLRDAQDSVDFQAMAKRGLAAVLDSRLRSDGELDRIWRQLRLDNRVVVLADGLEEALADHDDRDTVVRLAIHQAVAEQLPLIITSRPHNPLRNVEAFIIELESLGEGPALEYASRGPDGTAPANPTLNRQRMSWLIQSAQVVHAPLYLQVIRDLDQVGQLWSIFRADTLPAGIDGASPDSHPTDRVGLRWQLLDGWCKALVAGHLYQDHVLDASSRQAVIEVLSALACIGVRRDRLEVRFADLGGDPTDPDAKDPPYPELWTALKRRLGTAEIQHPELLDPKKGLPLAATMGAELGIVVAHRDGVRFRHSVMEAFLASRYLAVALRNPVYVDLAFCAAGREFLTALEFAFHTNPGKVSQELARLEDPAGRWASGRDYLIGRADRHYDHDRSKYLEIYATAFELDSRMPDPDPGFLLRAIAGKWRKIISETATLDRAIEQAKLQLVHRCGEAIRRVTGSPRAASRPARQLAAGAGPASVTRRTATARVGEVNSNSNSSPAASRNPGRTAPRGSDTPTSRHPHHEFYRLLRREQTYPVRLAGVQELGAGGLEAAAALRNVTGPSNRPREAWQVPAAKREEMIREDVLRAWLAPILFRSCHAEAYSLDGRRHTVSRRDDTTHFLDLWLERLVRMDPANPRTRPSITLEVALAQGFRLAANVRDSHSGGLTRSQALLIDKAEWALAHSRYWYSQLVLTQALTLLSLPGDPDQPLPDRGHGSDPRRQVNYWLTVAGSRCAGAQRSQPRHPFVTAAGELCTLALMTRRPAEYCWIDESGVASRVGSYSRERTSQYSQRSWILESAGWGNLHPLAQWLLGDVLVMLNLSERDGRLVNMDERLARADRWDLPPCIVKDRSPLEPGRTVGSAKTSEPGSNCLDDCRFRLCPYPPKGQPFYRSELGEGFCSRQISLLGKWYSPWGGASWQKDTRQDLKRFWRQMSERVRPEPPELPRPVQGSDSWG